ncbi:MAG TPA: lamin tail domain-containing protein, partial [Candidatus Krumholzibacterium sp.]|nr:lamin tail domain-containing protein [Candidatus Krumholzibacterium sp.]
ITMIAGSATGQVVISEFMPDPARDWDGDGVYNYRDDEWVEIANLGESPVDLDGYILCDGNEEGLWRYAYSGILDPGGVRVVFGSDSRAWEESAGFPVYGLSLNNSGDRILLYHAVQGDTVLVDSVEFGSSVALDDRSAGRDPSDWSVWWMYDAYSPCGDSCDPPGCGCVPTPGQVNTCTTANETSSWGCIKSLFRG